MTASVANLPANVLSAPVKKKRVLLVDTCRAKRDMRAETMRRLGVEVDCAADISEARYWWRPDLYNLVLFHVENELPHMYRFWDDIRNATPTQQVAFLVGKPAYLAASPNYSPVHEDGGLGVSPEPAAVSTNSTPDLPQDWGILEACRRISAVRSVSDARSRALRSRPLPRRDSIETKRRAAEVKPDAEPDAEPNDAGLNREEMQ